MKCVMKPDKAQENNRIKDNGLILTYSHFYSFVGQDQQALHIQLVTHRLNSISHFLFSLFALFCYLLFRCLSRVDSALIFYFTYRSDKRLTTATKIAQLLPMKTNRLPRQIF